MPMYDYMCPSCKQCTDVFKPIAKYDDPEFCTCGQELEHVFTTGDSPGSGNTAFRKPIEMFSIAPSNPQELEDLRQKCPDVEFTPQLVPLARSRAEKLRILAAVDAEEKS